MSTSYFNYQCVRKMKYSDANRYSIAYELFKNFKSSLQMVVMFEIENEFEVNTDRGRKKKTYKVQLGNVILQMEAVGQ
jgi:hypothetical protein